MKSQTWQSVAELLREAAARAIIPRFAALRAEDVRLKAPNEPVSVADRDAEALIGQGLRELLPSSLVIGEEACASDPSLLPKLAQGTVWLVDPVDGTGNFIAGRPPFAVMVALLQDGETVASWILDPLTDRIAVAERGGGSWIDGRRVGPPGDAAQPNDLCGIVSDAFIPVDKAPLIARLRQAVGKVVPTVRCAGYEYPQVALGERDFALYWRTLAWDHAPGVLFLTEAGGCVLHLDGLPYRPTAPRPGLLLARTPAIAAGLLEVVGCPAA
jgi:fructose-1,6-bisphosphatase/inositol monophosphatase family enzyme